MGVAQTGTAVLWNATMPPVANFLLNRPYAYLWQSVAQTLPGTSTSETIPIALDSGFDNAGGHNPSANNSRYVCQLAGLYHVTGQLGMQTPAEVGTAEPISSLTISVNSSANYIGTQLRFDQGPANAGGTVQASGYLQLNLGDFVELYATPYFNPITTCTDHRCPRMFIHWVSS
ncbi:hypothetical protein KGQ19_16035 [Catenulispora sp. NL8]|uniref:C1q domain-containing protein n=1 Tax=Catenulispora pinistramenti TaxID=2705254 RepID=A0ABS5KQS4_9ACTN|nr:hypothetical protein [Catenulispora pinistramenti]MBS2548376.1 hypothetical protein [Catenulispora pinistramenti]